MRRACWTLALLCWGASGCSDQGSDTEMVVVVWSDFAVPTEIDEVTLQVKGTETATASFRPSPSTVAGKSQLIQVSLVPTHLDRLAFELVVTGSLGDATVARQEVRSSCIAHERRWLTLFLGRDCRYIAPVEVAPGTLATDLPGVPACPPTRSDGGTDGGAEAIDADRDARVATDAGVLDSPVVDLPPRDLDPTGTPDTSISIGETPGLDAQAERVGAGGSEGGGAGGAGGTIAGTGGTAHAGGFDGAVVGTGGMGFTGGAGGAVVSTGGTGGVLVGTGGAVVGTGGTGDAGATGGAGGTSTTPAVECPQLGNPSDGWVSTTAGATVGSVATYDCSPSYALLGAKTLKCQSDGNWNGTAPLCVFDCGAPPAAGGGYVRLPNGTLEKAVGEYRCYADLQLISTGPTTTTCVRVEGWSLKTAPSCWCPPPAASGWGTACTPKCDSGTCGEGRLSCMGTCWAMPAVGQTDAGQ
jgi:Sushi repeat (SCR repeat)